MPSVDEELKKAVEAARSGKSDTFQALVKLLRAGPAGPLKELLGSGEALMRRAAILAARGRFDPAVTAAVVALAKDPDVAVRRALSEILADEAGEKVDAAVLTLLDDDDETVRINAARGSKRRKSLEAGLLGRLPEAHDASWRVRQTVAEALAGHSPRVVLPLLDALANDSTRAVQLAAAQSLEEQLRAAGGWPSGQPLPEHAVMEQAVEKLGGLGAKRYATLSTWLDRTIASEIDVKKLRDFGADLTAEAEEGRLPRAFGVDDACEELEKVLLRGSMRAAVLLGEPGSGTTAVVQELVHRIRARGWRVLRFSPVELLAGTKYLGEWQTKLNDLVRAAKSPRKVILYCPNLQELSDAGRTSTSDINMATALAPRVEAGEIAILGETTPEAFRAGLGAIGSLRRLFHAIDVKEADAARTRDILEHMQREAGATVPPKVLDRLLELADYYLAGTAQPGRAAGLFRRVLESGAGREGAPMKPRDVLRTLSASTGVPVDLLDDEVSLDIAGVRGFFEARVMGQGDAVDAVTDVVTLVKAGLTDPSKPFGVFLFVGPTGVGKTELARALAEYLFGDAKRLIRFDMSEFASYDAYERLIGRGAQPGLLTAAVRERPFSVVLLDEIEKAHANVFDLCLQLFDAGRLTDSMGRTADFRRTIVILTSNVGSRMQSEAPLGFGGDSKVAPTQDAILRELSRFFRPEFLNRLDRVVIFRPLAIETAEKIARREVAKVVERSGIARRGLVVDVDPPALALLLKEGYSPHFGARPLKRTVERMVLLPVARAISAGGVQQGTLLRLVARGERIEVEAAVMDAAGADRPSAAERSLDARAAALSTEVARLRAGATPIVTRKSELLAASGASGFWNDPSAARRVLDEVHRLDGVVSALDSLEHAVLSAAERAARKPSKERDIARQTERLDALEAEAARVSFLLSCRDARDLGDAFLALTLVKSQGASLSAVEKLANMYASLARRRGLEVEILDDRRGGDPHEDAIVLQVSGAGAFATLAGETGLHQVVRGRAERRDGVREDRDVVRVEVLPVPADAVFGRDEVRVETRPLKGVKGRLLDRPVLDVHLVHAPSMASVRAWTSGAKAEAVERLQPLLRARVDGGAGDGVAGARVVRRYTLGPSPLVRDQRTGRTTGRLDDVLDGDLGAFLQLPRAGFTSPTYTATR